ncbi:lytic transglycosylase [Reinekea marinisedimentorum]|uniref:lytic transglycosylase n=1 Tax=Reinekea marinisedimentorum TaxID=230495 RepID=UPI001FB336F2|nr:LysM peptidoglycan-binding domain-containing protein [Reinekea marinisedimentorum]
MIPSNNSSALSASTGQETESSQSEDDLISNTAANPKDEALALHIKNSKSADILATTTESKTHWKSTLDLSRPKDSDQDDLYQVLRNNLSFDLAIEDARITSQLNWYASHPSYIDRVSQRASRYMYYIVSEIQARDLPVELALLPIVESAFDPFAYSHGSASGMWQFISSTGKMYGLKQNWWYDGRRDVVASTDAALNYLSDLNRMFDGDWLLALASYNSGPGTVMKAQKKNRAAGKPTDFWHLSLPKETEAYAPKLVALAKLFSDPEKYGMEMPVVANEPYFEIVETGGQIDLAQAATLAEMELSDLYILNPGFNRWATDPDGPHHLLVFADKAEVFKNNISQLAANERLTWKRYTIQSGDSLLTIARKHDVTVDVLRDVNNIKGNLIRAGKTLMIPVASKNDQYYSMSAENRLKVKQSSLSNSSKQRVDYKVQSGDSFWTIARKFDVSVASIAKWNNMAPKDVIRPGQTLAIWVTPSNTDSASDSRQVVRKVGYVVRKGDSLYRIADKFNLSISDIEKWNQISSKYLQPGDKLTLYVDVTRIQ